MHVDLAHAFERTDEKRILGKQFSRTCALKGPLAKALNKLLDIGDLVGRELDALVCLLLLKCKPAVVARAEAMVYQDLLDRDVGDVRSSE